MNKKLRSLVSSSVMCGFIGTTLIMLAIPIIENVAHTATYCIFAFQCFTLYLNIRDVRKLFKEIENEKF